MAPHGLSISICTCGLLTSAQLGEERRVFEGESEDL